MNKIKTGSVHGGKPLADRLKEYISSGRISLHIPGHKGNASAGAVSDLAEIFSEDVLKADITEIDGFDDLHCPEGIIAEAQQLAADLFGADETFFLVNGTTSGIMAAVAATAYEEAPILVGRDCHKSVTRGLILGGGMPVYVESGYDEENGIPCGLSVSAVKEALESSPGVRGLILTNPSYYGTYSQLEEIVELCHSRGAVVIADEAHGAQLYFTDQEGISPALAAGCDVSIQSTHKMLGSLTQSSMLHVRGDLIDRDRLRKMISMMNTTSPSYLLMASLDAVRHTMEQRGREIWKNVLKAVSDASEHIDEIPGIRCLTRYTDADGIQRRTEGARLIISADGLGISGKELAEILTVRYHIDVEFSDHLYIIAAAGSGTLTSELEALTEALRDISAAVSGSPEFRPEETAEKRKMLLERNTAGGRLSHHSAVTPRKAFYSQHEVIPLAEASGKTAACDVAVYPPGIPALYPGEEVTWEIVEYLLQEKRLGSHIHGITEEEDGTPMICVMTGEIESMLFNMYF